MENHLCKYEIRMKSHDLKQRVAPPSPVLSLPPFAFIHVW